jgi:hypothetical protein
VLNQPTSAVVIGDAKAGDGQIAAKNTGGAATPFATHLQPFASNVRPPSGVGFAASWLVTDARLYRLCMR